MTAEAEAALDQLVTDEDLFGAWGLMDEWLPGTDRAPVVLLRLLESCAQVLELFARHRDGAEAAAVGERASMQHMRSRLKQALLRFVNALEAADRALAHTSWARHVAFAEALVRRAAKGVALTNADE